MKTDTMRRNNQERTVQKILFRDSKRVSGLIFCSRSAHETLVGTAKSQVSDHRPESNTTLWT